MCRAASTRFAGRGVTAGLLNFDERTVARGAEKTATRARVAGNAALIDQQQKRVAVAIDAQFDQALRVSGAFALSPQPLARSRPIADASGLERLGDGVAIHPGEHEQLAAVVLLRHRRNESVRAETQRRQHL